MKKTLTTQEKEAVCFVMEALQAGGMSQQWAARRLGIGSSTARRWAQDIFNTWYLPKRQDVPFPQVSQDGALGTVIVRNWCASWRRGSYPRLRRSIAAPGIAPGEPHVFRRLALSAYRKGAPKLKPLA